MERDSTDHTHGAGIELEPGPRQTLQNGLRELLRLTEGLAFRPIVSARYPLPLAQAVCDATPDPREVGDRVASRVEADPVGALDDALILLELCACNQGSTADFVPDDSTFLGMAFNTKRQNGWVAVLGDGDPEAFVEAVNVRWKFRLIPGPDGPAGVYPLLNMVARYGLVYGKADPGDSHALGHFIEDFAPALLVCRAGMDDLEHTLSLAAMKLGVPAVVPDDYPFPLGRQARAEEPETIGAASVVFPNIRRLLDLPDIPALPDFLDSANRGEPFATAATWGDTEESFYILRKGPVETPGVEVIGDPGPAMGVALTVDAEPMDAFDRKHIEDSIVGTLSLLRGVRASRENGRLVLEQAADAALSPERVGEALVAAMRHDFPKIERVRVELIFDSTQLAELAPQMRDELDARARRIAATTEDDVDAFGTCVGCSPFAPDHVCIITPERPPQCNRSYAQIQAGARYGYDDMSSIHHRTLHAEINSFGMTPKGDAVDARAGEWSGINAAASRLTDGRTARIQLHSLDEAPTTGCSCFQLVMFAMDRPKSGIGVMHRGYKGTAPDGRTWGDLHYALTGKQVPGLAGAAPGYLKSPRFLTAHDGWKSVVWVSPKIAAFMEEELPAGVEVGADVD